MPLVSFVVTCYNFAPFIGECLASIFNLTGLEDFEIIVLDDGSADGSAGVIRSFRHPNLHFVEHPKNVGPVATICEGLSLTRGKYVARIDGDDRYRPHFIQTTLPVMERDARVGLVYGDVAAMDDAGTIYQDPWLGIRSHAVHQGGDAQGDEYMALVAEHVVPAASALMRRAPLADALNGVHEFAFVDWYFLLRVARLHQAAYRAQTLADYRLHPNNRHRTLAEHPRYEATVLHILDQLFAEPDHAAEKRASRRRIYALTYLRFAEFSFARGDLHGARTRYTQAFALQPSHALSPQHARHYAATFMGAERYGRIKSFLERGVRE